MTARANSILIACLLGATAAAQQTRVVEVHVATVSGRDCYLDQGRAAGLQPGQIVRLFPPGVAELEVTIRSVTATSARAELGAGTSPPPVGTRGEVVVTAAATPAPTPNRPAPAPARPVPSHPPWQRQLDPNAPDQPLLVATRGQRPDERPMTLDGRLFGSTNWNRDTGGDRSDEYLLSRLGVHAEANNAFGQGERTRFDAELTDRYARLPDVPDSSEVNGRIDTLSTAFGTEHWAPVGVEVGRFLSPHLPEIGLVDGVETVLRFDNGVRFGGGIGAYPQPFPSRAAGDDLGVHAFFDYTSDPQRSLAATLGLQKTWHQGAPDRDLLLLRVEGRPRDDVWLYGTAKIDWYTSGDDRKAAGPEITELFAQARYDGPRIGGGVSLSHFAWPDLLRTEYVNLPDELVRDGKVDRVSLSAWLRPADKLRLSARTDFWQDQDNSGTALELGADWRDVLDTDTDLSVQVFRSDGGFQSGPGLRVLARRQCGDVFVNVGYRWYGYEISGLLTGTESYTRQAFEAGVSWAIGDADLDLQVERWFGSQEDAYAIGLYMQWRF